MKQTISEQALTLVEKKISDLKGQLTPQDAATATGVTVDEAQGALSRLMELYVTRVSYDNNGNLLFAFEMPLRRRGTKTAAERWAEVKESLWRGFKVFFKIWIGLMVIVYFAVMILLLLALMLAQSSSRDDRDRDNRGGGNMVGGLLRVLAEGLRFAFWSRAMSPGYYYGTDEYGYRHREMRTPRGVTGKEKSFIIAIYDLALGPERAPSDPLENEREVAAYLREEKGILTPAEIVALSGGTIADAEERMADYLVRFKGDPTITEESPKKVSLSASSTASCLARRLLSMGRSSPTGMNSRPHSSTPAIQLRATSLSSAWSSLPAWLGSPCSAADWLRWDIAMEFHSSIPVSVAF
jgi:hypothetical protein